MFPAKWVCASPSRCQPSPRCRQSFGPFVSGGAGDSLPCAWAGGDAAAEVKRVLRQQQELGRYLRSLCGFAQLDYVVWDF